MRTLASTLLAAQKSGTLLPLVRVVLTLGGSTYTYTKTRIWDIRHDEAPWSQTVEVTLDNADLSLTALDFKGYAAVPSWGLTTIAGAEYSAAAPVKVIDQRFVSTTSALLCVLTCWGMPNLMAEDRASATYAPAVDDTTTVKTLLTAICGATLASFNHCPAYSVSYDSEDSLIDSFQPKDAFRVYKNGSRLAAIRRLIDYTGCAIRWGADGNVHVFVPTTSGTTYDYEYSLATGYHSFWAKAYQQRLVIPNKITVESQTDDTPAYTGYATDAASFTLLPKQDFRQMRLVSDAQATSIAQAMILKEQLQAEGGSGVVPLNVGAEVYDYVKITDARENDARTGAIGYLNRHYSVMVSERGGTTTGGLRGRGERPSGKWEMTFGFGGWANYRKLLNDLETNTDLGQSFAKLYAKNAYIENLQADQIDLTTITQDDIGDGSTYARVQSVHLDSGQIILDDAVQYSAGYDPTTKMAGDADLDDIPDGSSYSRVLTTHISAGKIKLSSDTVIDGTWAIATGVSINASSGINIWGQGNALTTRATEAGTIQCYVGADGAIYAGAGAVKLSAEGITVFGDVGSGSFLNFQYDQDTGHYVFAAADGLWIQAGDGRDLHLNSLGSPAGTIQAHQDVIPAATGVNLGSEAYPFNELFVNQINGGGSRLILPVGTDMYG